MLPWARLPPDASLAAWWHTQPDAGPWADVSCHTVSAWCTAWRNDAVDAVRALYPGAAGLLVVSRTREQLAVHGLIPLHAPRAPVVGDALEHCARLPPGAVPPLAHITLEHTWSRRPHTLADVVFDIEAERPLLQRAAATLLDIARGQPPALDAAWPADAQLECAKARYYTRMCLLRAPVTINVHREAQRLGAEALGAWTAALVRRHVTSEARAAALVADEQLPFVVEAPQAAPPPHTCPCVPLPCHIDEPGALAALYARSDDPRAALLSSGGVACAPKADGRWALLSSGAAAADVAYVYAAALPCSLFVVLGAEDAAPGLASLLASLYLHGWAPPAVHGVSEQRVALADGRTLWAVPELVWPSGAALGRFVHAMWGVASAWVYERDGVLAGTFAPHPHTLWAARAPRDARQPARLAVRPAGMLRHTRTGATLAWHELAAWLGAAVSADVLRAHGSAPALRSVETAVVRELGPALVARLHMVATHAVAQTVSHDAAVVFGSRDYANLEAWVCEQRERLVAFFRALAPGEPVRADGHTRLRAGGHLSFTIDGPYRLCWRDYSMSRGGRHGRGLGPLIMYYLDGTSAEAALRWLTRWAEDYMAGDAPETEVAQAPAREPAAADLETARDKTRRRITRMTHVIEGTTAWRYLRETRGLSDAPRALIEENASLFARKRSGFQLDSGDVVAAAQLGCATATRAAMQLIYLDIASARKLAASGAAVKLTQGRLALGAGRYDAVPIVPAPAGVRVPRVFVAEGPETALSVASAYPETPVYAALGVGFIRGFGGVDAAEVVICRENDANGAHIAREIARAKQALATRFARVREVWPPAGYNDFNDVHQQHPGGAGTAIIRAHMDATLLV